MLVVVVSPGSVVDVEVVGAAHCDRSTMHPAHRAQGGWSGGVAAAASHRGTDSPFTIGHSQVSAQAGCTTPCSQYPAQPANVVGVTKIEVVVVVVVVVVVGPPFNVV